MYQAIQPVNVGEHGDWSLKSVEGFGFAAKMNALPILIHEFGSVAMECPLVFTHDDQPRVMAVVGVHEHRNQMLDADGRWRGRYVPAFLRRYPFTLASTDQDDQLVVCLDPDFEGWNQGNLGERLFDAAGEQTQFTQSVVRFVQDFHQKSHQSDAFCRRLLELDLLEPMSAQYRAAEGGDPVNVTGFCVVNRTQLMELSQDTIDTLFRAHELELIYLHLASLSRFSAIAEVAAE